MNAENMKSTKDKISDIKSKAKKCLETKKDVNFVIDILCFCQDEESSVAVAAVRALQQVFVHFLTSGLMASSGSGQTAKEDVSKEDQLLAWLQEQYETACDSLVANLDSTEVKLREASLVAVVKFIEVEGKHPLHPPATGQLSFPETLLQAVVGRLLSKTDNKETVIARLSEVTEHDDVRFFLMKAVKQELAKTAIKERNEVYLCNVICVLENLELPDSDRTEPLSKFLTAPDGDVSDSKVSSVSAHKKLFTACWMEYLRSELSAGLYRRVLTKLDEKVLCFLTSPVLLADFLTQSYNIGGAISLLALSGLFTLIQRYNLNYPDFYKKFYSLLEPQIFHVKYKARFFYLADLFLSSTHLPGYLVGSFIKRLARLALGAPPAGARLCIVFVYNLMVRHPSCAVLAHRPDHTCRSDPFHPEETDPAKTAAMDSSLWEIKSLQSHYSPEVAQEAVKINQPIAQEQLITDLLEDTTEQMIERAVKKKSLQVVMNTEKPKGLFENNLKRFFTLS